MRKGHLLMAESVNRLLAALLRKSPTKPLGTVIDPERAANEPNLG